ncbi:MAG TPA: phosphomannomutase/phosphoglucomutase [Candidatus Competibacteraceae bacterium]|nr:MAG: phosphomannomutase/phosphoglucomutase [Candidatus Competibacteraceae bacterium]HQA25867.1 phosphomannomutase/phosphoglucomutase [Candidatus Competibacteraceae bacterium]HQD57192.1 phosphomannomutase/phosphoglucomutase [Candidatus Competibacteraceae bacterium]
MKKSIFREYDIRGVVDRDLTPDVVHDIGQAVGSLAAERGENQVIVARDGRLSSPRLCDALKSGIRDTGLAVLDIGAVATPLLYYATHTLGSSHAGVMVTGSHNPPQYNGLKIVIDKIALHGAVIDDLRRRIETGDLCHGQGSERSADIHVDYIQRIVSELRLPKPLKVVVDCGNAIAADTAPSLLRALGCEVVELYCEVDGRFPNHHPDPSVPDNLADLQAAVVEQGADIGLAFDGDADRLGVVTAAGEIIWPDRILMPLAEEVLREHPGAAIVYDIKCSRHLTELIERLGGRPILWKTGHSLIKAKMRETGALLGGEMTGHIVHADRWFGFDDAFYAAARLLRLLARHGGSSTEFFAAYPTGLNTPELRVDLAEGEPFAFMQRLAAQADFGADARLITLDGLRVEWPHGWGLVRASNTTPSLVLRFEADDPAAMADIQDRFRSRLLALRPDLALPF